MADLRSILASIGDFVNPLPEPETPATPAWEVPQVVKTFQQIGEAHRNSPKIPYVDQTPFATEHNNRSGDYSAYTVQRIIDKAQEAGIDPYLALSIGLHETNLSNVGNTGINPLHENNFPQGKSDLNDMLQYSMQHLSQIQDKVGSNPMEIARRYNGTGNSGYDRVIPYNQKIAAHMDSMKKNALIKAIVESQTANFRPR